MRPGPGQAGGLVEVESPIHYSNLKLVCPVTREPTRIAYRFNEDGTKMRVSKKSGAEIPRPAILSERRTARGVLGPKDTSAAEVLAASFDSLSITPKA